MLKGTCNGSMDHFPKSQILKMLEDNFERNLTFFGKINAHQCILPPIFFGPKSLHGLGQKISTLPNFAVILG